MSEKSKISKKIDLHFPDEKSTKGDAFVVVERETGEMQPVAEVVTEDEETRKMMEVSRTLGKFKFVVVFQDRYDEVLKDLTPVAAKILSCMIANMKVGNRVYDMAYSDFCKKLGFSAMTASRGINQLIEKQIISKLMHRNRPVYFIDPALCYKGKLDNHKKLNEEYSRYTENAGSN